MKRAESMEAQNRDLSLKRNLKVLLALAILLFVIAPAFLWWWHQRTDVLPIVWKR